ncbi:sensor histidine kinase [Sporosarcina sp. BI001-red]|uniref:sensor histidine kinase n=1 Tax=Sporosarcina sp. BI001-red TaxID=2282866 RepID=UPI000E229753|nr:HAMP domain-containing sensor histidine kinase [Sporosarcina sp. BI001-red]REB11624.1 sensor histidine kinase [Sporosarcina sp. BI001-red]
MSSKITLRFVGYFFIFYLSIAVASILIIILLAIKGFSDFNAYTNIREADIGTIESHIERDSEGNFLFSNAIKKSAEESGGFLELIDKEGNVISSSAEESEKHSKYTFTDFNEMSADKGSYIWLLKKDRSLLFIERTDSDVLLETLITSKSFPSITNDQKRLLEEHKAVFELYNADGSLIHRSKDNGKDALNGMELLEMSQVLAEQKEIKASKTLEDGTTAVVRMPNPHYAPFDTTMINFLKKFLIGIALFHGILLLFIILFSLWIGQRFGRPVFYFMKKIEKLSRKDYGHVKDHKIRNEKDGRLKKKYRVYEDVDVSLITLANNLEENERKLQKTEQLREDWITGLSHDLKTPLSSIYGYSVMLESSHNWTGEEVKKFASVMQEKANYMDALINDLTYTYQLKNDGVLIEIEKIELGKFIHEYARKIETETVNFPEVGASFYVAIDPRRFTRVLDNVIGNAIKHNPEGTPIHVDINLENDWVLLEVRDEGIGMSPTMMENLFDRYYRGTNTTSGDSGTGLGLTIAKQLVEAHGGKISVDSNNYGTTITIRLLHV